jgi:hypothetical protein
MCSPAESEGQVRRHLKGAGRTPCAVHRMCRVLPPTHAVLRPSLLAYAVGGTLGLLWRSAVSAHRPIRFGASPLFAACRMGQRRNCMGLHGPTPGLRVRFVVAVARPVFPGTRAVGQRCRRMPVGLSSSSTPSRPRTRRSLSTGAIPLSPPCVCVPPRGATTHACAYCTARAGTRASACRAASRILKSSSYSTGPVNRPADALCVRS